MNARTAAERVGWRVLVLSCMSGMGCGEPADPGFPHDDNSPTPTTAPTIEVWQTGAVLVSDTSRNHLQILRLKDSALLWDYYLPAMLPDRCPKVEDCITYQSRYKVIDDQDFVDFAVNRVEATLGEMHRVSVATPDPPVFSIQGYDFTGVPAAGCTAPSSETCNPDKTTAEECIVWFEHSFEITHDDPEGQVVTAIVGDHHGRILQATLDYQGGNTCAKVDWVLDENTPDWSPTCAVNTIQYIQEDGKRYLAVTCRNLPAPGEGQIQLFRLGESGDDPLASLVWTWPQPSHGTTTYLNTPHGGVLQKRADGGYDLTYAHSSTLTEEFDGGRGGTVGTARLSSLESIPDYVSDEGRGASLEDDVWGYLKNAFRLPDSYRLVGDWGSDYGDPIIQSGVYILAPAEVENSTLEGYWTTSRSALQVKDVTPDILASYYCGWGTLFSVSWIDPADFGTMLRSSYGLEGSPCEVVKSP